MRWIKRAKGVAAGWRVLAAAPEEFVSNKEELVPLFAINDILHEMIEEAKSKGKMKDASLIQAPAEDEHEDEAEDEDAMDEDEDGAR